MYLFEAYNAVFMHYLYFSSMIPFSPSAQSCPAPFTYVPLPLLSQLPLDLLDPLSRPLCFKVTLLCCLLYKYHFEYILAILFASNIIYYTETLQPKLALKTLSGQF